MHGSATLLIPCGLAMTPKERGPLLWRQAGVFALDSSFKNELPLLNLSGTGCTRSLVTTRNWHAGTR
jgi:hypothetical protein